MRRNRLKTAAPWPATVIATLVTTLIATSAFADDIKLSETGSSLLYPLFSVWAAEYSKTHPGVTITTASTGSGAGIDQALAGQVQIGASDAYMSDQQARKNPEILNIPLAISALTVNYNIPELKTVHLKLDGPTLANIYSGKVTMWDDAEIAGLNPGTTLPHQPIVPVRRIDASGDSFVFSQYLTFTTPWWEDKIGFGTTVKWPEVAGATMAEGNAGVLKAVADKPYALTYLGVSYHGDVEKAGLGTAALKSYSGEFVLLSPESVTAASASLGPRTPADERLTLVNAPGINAYPLVNYEYVIVSKKQPAPATAAAIRRFLHWASAPDEANGKLLDDARFIALPAHIWVLTSDQIDAIQ
jgi:phosphate transport system substrate-binding protein